MSWLRKSFHKVKKSVRRIAHGKFHLNPLRNHFWQSTSPVHDIAGHNVYRFLSRHQQHRLAKAIDWGHFKKKYLNKYLKKFIPSGNNSASAVYFGGNSSGYFPSSYYHQSRTLSQMTGGY